MNPDDETRAVVERYARRGSAERYSLLRPEVWQMVHERQRALLRLLVAKGVGDLASLRLTEVGCGSGANLLELLRLGFSPQHLHGIELLAERATQARHQLPAAVRVTEGDALRANIAAASQDLLLQSTVFSSLLDDTFQQALADAMWGWLKPGGALVWYDFTFDNPRNPDVRGVPLSRVRRLFPQGEISYRRVTLLPPLARWVCRLHPGLYSVFNALPLLRTHVLAWITKPEHG